MKYNATGLSCNVSFGVQLVIISEQHTANFYMQNVLNTVCTYFKNILVFVVNIFFVVLCMFVHFLLLAYIWCSLQN